MKTTIDSKGVFEEKDFSDQLSIGVKTVINDNFLALNGGTINLYVNSQNGSDNNNGNGPLVAFQTLDKALSILSKNSYFLEANVYLASGSYTMSGSYNLGSGQINILGVRQVVQTCTVTTDADDGSIWDVSPPISASILIGATSNVSGANNVIAVSNTTNQIQFMQVPPTELTPTSITMTRPGVDIRLTSNTIILNKTGLPFKFENIRFQNIRGSGTLSNISIYSGIWQFVGTEFISNASGRIIIRGYDSVVMFGTTTKSTDISTWGYALGTYIKSDTAISFTFERCELYMYHTVVEKILLTITEKSIARWRGINITGGGIGVDDHSDAVLAPDLTDSNRSILINGYGNLCSKNSVLRVIETTIQASNDNGIAVYDDSTLYLTDVDGGLHDGVGVNIGKRSSVYISGEVVLTGTGGDLIIGIKEPISWDDVTNNGVVNDLDQTVYSQLCLASFV
jgi:hypothetical protein